MWISRNWHEAGRDALGWLWASSSPGWLSWGSRGDQREAAGHLSRGEDHGGLGHMLCRLGLWVWGAPLHLSVNQRD